MQRLKPSVFALKILRLFLLVGVLAFVPMVVKASVTLVSFEVSEETGWARLEWETATEIDNAGFFIRRSATGGNLPGNYTQIPVVDMEANESTTFIPAQGDSLLGATYGYYDQDLTPGDTFYYLLEAVDSSNYSEFHGPITITLSGGNPTPTFTPTLTKTPTPSFAVTASITPTITTTPTTTPTPTITNTPTRTPTPPPTFPPLNTVTPTRTQTPTLGPSSTNTPSPTVTLTPSVTLHPLDLTLTAVLAQVTPLPTYTPRPPTRTPFPTLPSEISPTATPSYAFLEGVSSTGVFGLLLVGIVIFGGGGALTFIFILSRRKESKP